MKQNQRLSKEEWKIIKGMIEDDISITEISKSFNISRHSLYKMAWRNGWIKKKNSFWKNIFKRLRNGGK